MFLVFLIFLKVSMHFLIKWIFIFFVLFIFLASSLKQVAPPPAFPSIPFLSSPRRSGVLSIPSYWSCRKSPITPQFALDGIMFTLGLRLLALVLPVSIASSWTITPTSLQRPFQRTCRRCKFPLCVRSSPEEDAMGLNELQTLLRNAALKEDFVEAGRLSDLLIYRMAGDNPPTTDDEIKARRLRMSWSGLGAAPWLVDRLDVLY